MRRFFPTLLVFLGVYFFEIEVVFAADVAAHTVRVLIAENKKTLRVAAKGAYEIRSLPDGKLLANAKDLQTSVVEVSSGKIRIGKLMWNLKGIRIDPVTDRNLYVNQTRYRGSVDFYRSSGGGLDAINTLDLEGYLYGVLHHEVAAWWPMEALRAQAVAARTYALYQVETSRAAVYDLKSTTSSQVYGGSTTERYRTKRAVDETRGQVLTYQEKIFPAYFHATCGGKTAAAAELWKIDIPPLGGGAACSYCRISPHYRWKSEMALASIEEKLSANSRSVGRLLKIEPMTQTPSARVGRLGFVGTLGEAEVAAKDFRVWLGGDKIRSTAFTVRVREDRAEFEGKGWGHGVGLCQWGALGQSLFGKKSEEILGFYYPGSEVKEI